MTLLSGEKEYLNSYMANRIFLCGKLEQRERKVLTSQVYV